jgi:CRISPR-associated exonuclease Cas4
MMINVSWISEYIYCPIKLYLRYYDDEGMETMAMVRGRMTHEILRGFEELIKRNLWSLKEEMNLKEITDALFVDVTSFIENTGRRYEESGVMDSQELQEVCQELKWDLKFDACLLALKATKIMENTQKTGADLVDMLFTPSLLEMSLKNKKLNLKGKVDKIELSDGYYYPIEIKSGKPPVKGVWESDAIQIAAYATLIQEEFKKEVSVGFVDYTQIGERRMVVVDEKLKQKLSNLLEEIQSLLEEGYTNSIVQNPVKCGACDYTDLCQYCNE